MPRSIRMGTVSPVTMIVAFFVFSILFETAYAGHHRRFRRQPVAPPAGSAVQRETLSEKAPPIDLAALCVEIRQEAVQPRQGDLVRCRERLHRAGRALARLLDGDPNRESAAYWRSALKLDDLTTALAAEGEPDADVLLEVWNAFNADRPGVKWLVFNDVRKELRRFQTLRAALQGDNYQKQLANVCDNLQKYIDEYSKGVDPAYGVALNDVMIWLEDIGIVEPRAEMLAQAALARLSSPNLRLHAGADFVAAGFQGDLSEEFVVDDVILGTRVSGSGTFTGQSNAEIRPSRRGAEIRILVDASIETNTTGRQAPVTLDTRTWGTMHGEKRICLSPEHLSVIPARTRAMLQSTIYNIRINAGPIVQCIARKQIQQRRGASQAEAGRRAERRMNLRIDEQVDPRIAELNENYQTKIRRPLLKTGLFPRIWDVSSSDALIETELLIGDITQPAAASRPPEAARDYGLFVQVHQSALNNAAAIALSGRAFDEEKVAADLEKQFKELPQFLQREEGQKPIHVTFAAKTPIAISFVGNRIKSVFRIDSFIQDGTNYPGLDVTLLYDVKTVRQKGEDGRERDVVVLEQVEAPQAFPRGFDPSKDRVSARHQAIRTIVLRRLEKLPKKVEGKPRELKGEWEGDGVLLPVFAASNDGWLTFAWDWIPAN